MSITLTLDADLSETLQSIAERRGMSMKDYATASLRRVAQDDQNRPALLADSLSRIEAFLTKRMREGDILEAALQNARVFQQALVSTYPDLAKPDAAPGDERGVLFWWDAGEHHLELEIFADAPAEWFYRNRIMEACFECIWQIGEPIPSEVNAVIGSWLGQK